MINYNTISPLDLSPIQNEAEAPKDGQEATEAQMYVVNTNISLKRKMRTDRTTRLLIVILCLFLISEFPQVFM